MTKFAPYDTDGEENIAAIKPMSPVRVKPHKVTA